MNNYLKYTIRWILFISIQAFFLNKISPLHGFIYPQVYILFILWMPLNFSKTNLLLLAFFTGIALDVLLLTPGLYACTAVLVAYLRGYFLGLFKTSAKMDLSDVREPSINTFSFATYLIYLLVFSFIHNFFIIFIARLTFTNFFFTIFQIILSTVYSVVFMLLIEFVFQRKDNKTF